MTAHIAVNTAKLVRSAQPSMPMDIGTPSLISNPMLRAPDHVTHHASAVMTTTTPAIIRRSRGSGLIGLPGEWSKVTVVLSARVVPVDAEGVKMAACCACKCEPRVRWVERIVDVQRFVRYHCTGNALALLIQEFGYRHRSPKTALLNLDRTRLHSEEFSNYGSQNCGRTTGLATGDGGNGLLLLGSRAVVNDQSDLPSTFRHDFWRMPNDS